MVMKGDWGQNITYLIVLITLFALLGILGSNNSFSPVFCVCVDFKFLICLHISKFTSVKTWHQVNNSMMMYYRTVYLKPTWFY